MIGLSRKKRVPSLISYLAGVSGGMVMAIKRYRKSPDGSARTQSKIHEAKAEAYGREKSPSEFLRNSLSVTALKRKLNRPVKRNKNQIAWALGIAGIGEGPKDLSKNMRDYLFSDR